MRWSSSSGCSGNDLDYYARVRIQARIAELTPLVLELHKRKIKTEDSPDDGSRQ
jgi:hypothetical protein